MILPARSPASRRWTAEALLARDGWRVRVPAAVADEFHDLADARPDLVASPASAERGEFHLPELQAFALRLRSHLVRGDGVAWLHEGALLGLDGDRGPLFHALLGASLGTPLEQYGRLFPIKDRGVDHLSDRVPVSMTSARTEFHTDSSSVDVLPDLVGLHCEQEARDGGDSLVSNAAEVRARLAEEAPELLEILRRPLIRDIVTPGSGTSLEALLRNAFPVFGPAADGPEFMFRYMRLWIERGQSNAGRPLDAESLRALDTLDALLTAPEHSLSFRLRAGDSLWVDNRLLAHDRTRFVDDPAKPRLLYRMWVQTPAEARRMTTPRSAVAARHAARRPGKVSALARIQ